MKDVALRAAIAEAFSPDPHLEAPDPETVAAVTELVLLMAAVSKSRRKSLAAEPWKRKTVLRHLMHASNHVYNAQRSIDTPGLCCTWLDSETRIPNAAHAALRLAFALYRVKSEGVPT